MRLFPRPASWMVILALALPAAFWLAPGACAKSKSQPAVAGQPATVLPPVYIHMNGFNDFLESVLAVQPGQPVIFVNQDTGAHTIQGYDPRTGQPLNSISGMVMGTPGPGHKISTYRVILAKPGIYYYYCTIHAVLQKVYHHMVQPEHRPGVHGFGGAMAGVIIVTKEKTLLRENPPTCHVRTLKGYFGG